MRRMVDVLALVFGAIYLLLGIVGFIVAPTGGLLLGIFAVNPFHHGFHVVLGGSGLAAGLTRRGLLFCAIAGILLLALGVLGFVTPDLISMLMGHPPDQLLTDNLLHLITGVGLAYFWIVARAVSPGQRRVGSSNRKTERDSNG